MSITSSHTIKKMTSPARPKSRQSMNPAVGLVERNLNAEKIKGKKRAVMSMGGKPSGEDTLSPKSLARRTAVSSVSSKPWSLLFFLANSENGIHLG